MDKDESVELLKNFVQKFANSKGQEDNNKSILATAVVKFLRQNFDSMQELFNQKLETITTEEDFSFFIKKVFGDDYFKEGYNHQDVIKYLSWTAFMTFEFVVNLNRSTYTEIALSVLFENVKKYIDNEEFDECGGFVALRELASDYCDGKIAL